MRGGKEERTKKANMFGRMRAIQNGEWNCMIVRSTNMKPVGCPRYLLTARQSAISPTVLALARHRHGLASRVTEWKCRRSG